MKAARKGRRSLLKDARRHAEEIGMKLDLQHPKPIGHTKEDEVVGKQKLGEWTKKAMKSRRNEEIEEEKWQGELVANRWNEEDLDKDCFAWTSDWKTAPTHRVAGIHELYQQLLPTKIYSKKDHNEHRAGRKVQIMRQRSRIHCTCAVGMLRASADKTSSKTQWAP